RRRGAPPPRAPGAMRPTVRPHGRTRPRRSRPRPRLSGFRANPGSGARARMRSLSLAIPERTLGRLIVVLLLRHPRRPEDDPVGLGETFGDLDALAEAGARGPQRELGVAVVPARHVDAREQDIADLVDDRGHGLALGLRVLCALGAQPRALALQ